MPTNTYISSNIMWEMQRAALALGAGKIKPKVSDLLIYELDGAGRLFHPSKNRTIGDKVPYHDTIFDPDEDAKNEVNTYFFNQVCLQAGGT